MYLSKLSLQGFKNYEHTDIELSEGINILYGPNGSGKTNMLDAVHYLSNCKSFLVSSDVQNIKSGTDVFFLEAWLTGLEQVDILQCAVKRGQGKVFRRNKKEYEKLSDHIGFFPSVLISPGDSELLYGGSAERRKFIDSLISVYDRPYLEQLIAYARLLEQRNAFLKQCHEKGLFRNDLLDIYDEQMAEPALYLHNQRKALNAEILPLFYEMYQALAGSSEVPHIEIKADLLLEPDPVNMFIKAREKDKNLLYTSAGPHKDDLEFYLAGRPVKNAASQGQQKTFLTALKLARFHLIHRKTGKRPILLLDDIFDKLDDTRVQNLIKIISEEPFAQVLITDTGISRISALIAEIGTGYQAHEINNQIVQHEKAV